ncbi:MAG: hypothetical protein A3A28_00070 [Candidatus Sungbacteria bacterium RIFCSPLOWO2_01_FULL_47_32]|uniref:GIY-YIG domain-containing protein n=1 Tax=Candidatus Sungbacteria bacterium RIFCSPHIGHO2_01_FULL_47_32 TaxID=1802264 RepID=A0A1G2K5M3_9BACT|nr:MAG: hypothetical protein UX72_C0029G0014 [Parcubacteria group bacterium GW2011_GWA2_47_10]OGZ94732.1 MAG: hypothetical protein A2633_03675 [Candidatus Sungbacteria bacterium RIFCSPHIGHO2_01_FULL_47_32]OHA05190.1 MAG: hypothetical protein A3A28_00070 [Candidatus Sungbacteria bacterium RIFCSPLOWO2_01_FULL_47_32]
MYYLYIIRCKDKSLYTGITTDPVRRFKEHREGAGARYTRSHAPERIVYVERFWRRGSAQKREAAIKKLSRKNKLVLMGKHPYGI